MFYLIYWLIKLYLSITKIIMLGFAFEEAVKKSKENYETLEKLERDVLSE